MDELITTKEEPEMDSSTVKTTADLFAKEIKVKTSFGWQLDTEKSDKRALSKKNKAHFIKLRTLVFKRPKDLLYHDKLMELEKKYEELENQKQFYIKADPINAFFLFLLVIIPGIIYVVLKAKKKKKVKENNEAIDAKQAKLLAEAQQILSISKIPFTPVGGNLKMNNPSFSNPYNQNSSSSIEMKSSIDTNIKEKKEIPFSKD